MPSAERKSGIPLSVETPAPVSATHGWLSRISSLSTPAHGEEAGDRDDERREHKRGLDEPAVALAEGLPRQLEGGVERLAREARGFEHLDRLLDRQARELVARRSHVGTVEEPERLGV